MARRSLLMELLATIASRTGFQFPQGAPLSVSELEQLCHELVSTRGEATGMRLAVEIVDHISQLDDAEQRAFFEVLADDFSPSDEALRAAAENYLADPGAETAARLHRVSEPPRQELFRRLNLAPGGTAELVRMRERLLPLMKADRDRFGVIDADFTHLFQSWFNRGFLILQSIDWTTSASVLEKIIRYENVHAIGSWEELRNRLAPEDRRCFAFFHPSIPNDPLIFVEVALMDEIPAAIETVLNPDRPHLPEEQVTTAVFYSISNCHDGLSGVSFGSFLIKQVAEDLKAELPGLKTFVTLSPVPGFAKWTHTLDPATLDTNERRALEIVAEPGWTERRAEAEAARPGLLSLGARYFLREKRPNGEPIDPVARFHLRNGAILNRIMHMGDVSAAGLQQGHGLMVNYLYDMQRIEERHEAYVTGREISASRAVHSLLTSRPERLPAKASS